MSAYDPAIVDTLLARASYWIEDVAAEPGDLQVQVAALADQLAAARTAIAELIGELTYAAMICETSGHALASTKHWRELIRDMGCDAIAAAVDARRAMKGPTP